MGNNLESLNHLLDFGSEESHCIDFFFGGVVHSEDSYMFLLMTIFKFQLKL
uniref:Uncharacterized protein n=1 Tax=Kalanchoe fedtschenkoi TaxID=63787 RepID=A0A7N0TP18_KALFE